jgi:multidrug efflux pump subunit AcrA (membrane-fusion protein)
MIANTTLPPLSPRIYVAVWMRPHAIRSTPLTVQMESVVSSPVSGKVKRVLVVENDSIAQGDLVVEVTH